MLHLLTVRVHYDTLASGQLMKYIELPAETYDELKEDFTLARHFQPIVDVDMSTIEGMMIKCENKHDGLLAVAYLMKKCEHEQEASKEGSESFDEDEECPVGQKPHRRRNGSDDDGDDHDARTRLFHDGKLVRLPVVQASEFVSAHFSQPQFSANGQFSRAWGEPLKGIEPYWLKGTYPLIVVDDSENSFGARVNPEEQLRNVRRFVFYIYVEPKNDPFSLGFPGKVNFEKTLSFDLDYEICQLGEISSTYYETVLKECAAMSGYQISKKVNKANVITELKTYRHIRFSSCLDIETLVRKAIKKKKGGSKILTGADFDTVFVVKSDMQQKQVRSKKRSSAIDELNELKGLTGVKTELIRLVTRMKYDRERKKAGYAVTDTHIAAVFMGSPGTAKTTVARIFCKILCEEEVLFNESFIEVSRKDLVGRFVGHTAPLVADLFAMYKGGTIFIDEAYSLMTEGRADGYSEEALAEIIRQMENNPDTLVIFAGYTDKMKQFIHYANPGLRSRLTNIVEFADYKDEEMLEIFTYFLEKEAYTLGDQETSTRLINAFLTRVRRLDPEKHGNGRLMRKLFKMCIAHMAERADNDMKTIAVSDIERAIADMDRVDRMLSAVGAKTIGFRV